MNLVQGIKLEKEILSKKDNFTDSFVETQDISTKLNRQKSSNIVEEDEFWNDVKNLDSEIKLNL